MKFFKRLAAVSISAVVLMSSAAYAEGADSSANAPDVQAKSAILVNADTGRILYEKNIYEKMYPASMTKMLTAMVVLDSMNPEDTIKVDYSINEIPLDSSRAGVTVGEIFKSQVAFGIIITRYFRIY